MLRRLVLPLAVSIIPLLAGCMAAFGGSPTGNILDRIRSSPQFHEKKFENEPPVAMIVEGKYFEMLRGEAFGGQVRTPPRPLPVVHPDVKSFSDPPAPGLRAIWFGHASVLLEVDGVRIFTDPILSDRASPFENIGPQRFFSPPLSLEELPRIDAVVISHDHYDHLDMKTIKFLATRGTMFYVPLGVGAHLTAWGIADSQVHEMDWWERLPLKSVEFICTPAVHYSGRGLFGGNQTLWSSWTIVGPQHRVFHSGDSGFSPHFKEIGQRFGPFDLTLIKIGAYDPTWIYIHMDPEQAMSANVALGGRRMLPIHWGTFNLQIHSWDEPILRTKAAAESSHQDLVTPRPGEILDADKPYSSAEWWK